MDVSELEVNGVSSPETPLRPPVGKLATRPKESLKHSLLGMNSVSLDGFQMSQMSLRKKVTKHLMGAFLIRRCTS